VLLGLDDGRPPLFDHPRGVPPVAARFPERGADFEVLLAQNPSFTGDQLDDFASFLDERVSGPDDGSILERVATSAFRPHKRLLDHVAQMIRNEPVLTLLDEQQVAYNAIMDEVRTAGQNQRRWQRDQASTASDDRTSSTTSIPAALRSLTWR